MSDFWRAFLMFVAAVNPPAVALAMRDLAPGASRRASLVGVAVALAL